MPLEAAVVVQPPEPPPKGCGPALPDHGRPQLDDQAGDHLHIHGGDGVLQRLLGQVVARAPGGGAVSQQRGQMPNTRSYYQQLSRWTAEGRRDGTFPDLADTARR